VTPAEVIQTAAVVGFVLFGVVMYVGSIWSQEH
jgi:hypothetical protein